MSKYVVVISYDTGDTFNPSSPAENIEFEYDEAEEEGYSDYHGLVEK